MEGSNNINATNSNSNTPNPLIDDDYRQTYSKLESAFKEGLQMSFAFFHPLFALST